MEKRIQYLEKQNAALIKALQNKDPLLQMLVEQQRQILALNEKVGALTERNKLYGRWILWLKNKF